MSKSYLFVGSKEYIPSISISSLCPSLYTLKTYFVILRPLYTKKPHLNNVFMCFHFNQKNVWVFLDINTKMCLSHSSSLITPQCIYMTAGIYRITIDWLVGWKAVYFGLMSHQHKWSNFYIFLKWVSTKSRLFIIGLAGNG